MRMEVSLEEARDMEQAHIEGFHDDFPRQFCPVCDDKPLSSYKTEQQIRERMMAAGE